LDGHMPSKSPYNQQNLQGLQDHAEATQLFVGSEANYEQGKQLNQAHVTQHAWSPGILCDGGSALAMQESSHFPTYLVLKEVVVQVALKAPAEVDWCWSPGDRVGELHLGARGNGLQVL